jgi:ABC-type transport system substrate-binding protein
MAERRLGIIMNGVTGRMGTNQHLVRSIVAIRGQGGVALRNGDRVMPDPILVGRNEEKVAALAKAHGLSRFTTNLDAALADKNDTVFFDAATTKLEYNQQKAKALLAEAGVPNGFDLEINTRSSEAYIAEAVSGFLHRVGIKAKVKTETEVAYRELQRNGKIQALMGHFDSLGIPDVGGELPFFFSGDATDYAKDAKLTDLTRLSSQAANPTERRKAIGDALDLNNTQAYVLPISGGPKVFVNSADVVIPTTELNGYGAILARLKWK